MSKFKYGQKIEIKNAELDIEVIGVLPAGQPFQMNISGEILYNATMNGLPVYLKESVLDMIVNSQIKSETKDEDFCEKTENKGLNIELVKNTVPAPALENNDTTIPNLKEEQTAKKRGRPSKNKEVNEK